MEKVLGTLMEQLRDDELRIKMLHRMIRKQRMRSKKATLFDCAFFVYILVNEARWAAQKDTNKELRKELAALKQTKGE